MKYAGTWKQLYEIVKDHLANESKYVIDIGARDISTSNLRPFVDADYRCLFVEPNPHQVVIIEEEMEKFNAHTWLAPVAITEKNGIIDFVLSPNTGHCRIPNENFDRNKWQTEGQKNIKVECWTFAKLLEEYPAWEDAVVVDIDTEGYDTVVLKSLFETQCRPMFIMVEDWDDQLIMKQQAEILINNNYELFSNAINQSKIWTKIN